MQKIKKIAITGGKGGVGKSTAAVLVAKELAENGKKVILCDCDIECPNDYLLLNQKLEKPIEKVFSEFPKLIKSKCVKCGKCVNDCPSNAIFQAPGKYPMIIKDLCSGCGICFLSCPYKAIGVEKEEVGKIYLNQIKIQESKIKNNNFYLITGLAKAALEETGPIVTKTKKIALKFAERVKADYILFDTAAGTHCPVVSALLDCHLAFVVTEPTPMGAHDLDLILNLCRKLKVKPEIILNRSDLGNKKLVEKIAKSYKIKIRGEIPYSKKLFENYSKGKLLKFKPEFSIWKI